MIGSGENIENLFKKELEYAGIFKDTNVLSPHYVPPELPHRKTEALEITKVIAPILRDARPDNIFIYGKTGTGKTALSKYVTEKLCSICGDPEKNPNNVLVKIVYMNCRIKKSKYNVLITLLTDPSRDREDVKEARPLSGRPKGLEGTSPSRLYDILLKVVEKNAMNLVVILDEIDQIKDKDIDDLMYMLTRINDEVKEVKGKRGKLIIIGISNSIVFKDKLDPRSKSTLCEHEIVFKPYNANQLETILTQRVELGFQPDTIGKDAIALIAAYAAKTNGDARYALRLLQKAGEVAENARKKVVDLEDVKKSKKIVEENIIRELVSSLPEHEQIVLYSIADEISLGRQKQKNLDSNQITLTGFKNRIGSQKGSNTISNDVLFSGEAYEAYERVCSEMKRAPRTMRWFGEYLNELEMLGLIAMAVSSKGVRGNTRFIRLGYPPEEIKEMVTQGLNLGEQQ